MITAQEAIQRLRDGNRRFVDGTSTNATSIDQARRAELVDGQSPFAVVVACSDSRAPVELLFDQGLGDLFVIRVAGNVLAPTQLGSVEYAVSQLGAELVVVLGHTGCGAVAATVDSLSKKESMPSPNLEAIVERIRPAVKPLITDEDGADLDAAVIANIRQSIDDLAAQSEILASAIASRNLSVTGACYSLETGHVEFLDT